MSFNKELLAKVFGVYAAGSDKLPAHLVGEAMRAAGANPTVEEVNTAVGTAQALSLAQLESAMSKQKIDKDPVGDIKECLEIFDINGTGKIDAGEFRNVLSNLGDGFDHAEIGQLMLVADIDADNQITIAELIKFLTKYSK